MTPHLQALLERDPPVRIRWGLERVEAMLRALGDPHLSAPVIHVAGTNGKGSTAVLAESMLRQAGRRTGLFTSPHLVEFGERIRVAGAVAEPDLLEACARDVLPLAKREDATFFEASTVLAFESFQRAGCDVVVAEVGLGGRRVATNIVAPAATVIASVDRDHFSYLGDTLEEIAAEKAGVLKPGIPVAVGRMAQGPLRVIERRARELGVPMDLLGREMGVEQVHVDLAGTSFVYRPRDPGKAQVLRTPLVGRHQAENAALAIRAVHRSQVSVSPEAVRRGLERVRWPGRFEVRMTSEGVWVLDVAHNTAAAVTLAELLEALPLPRPIVVVVAILGDKPWREMLDPLLSASSAGVFTVAPSSPIERRWIPQAATDKVRGHRVEVETDFERALARGRELAGTGTVVVTGSAFTVGDASTILG
jgi:dihydrofolate synthase/folylpolyglutamate synthase